MNDQAAGCLFRQLLLKTVKAAVPTRQRCAGELADVVLCHTTARVAGCWVWFEPRAVQSPALFGEVGEGHFRLTGRAQPPRRAASSVAAVSLVVDAAGVTRFAKGTAQRARRAQTECAVSMLDLIEAEWSALCAERRVEA